jgi:predicted nuclease of predicted toxin-antitoxin system
MRFLLDMGISVDVSGFLRNHGHDVEHLHEQGLGTLPDSDILARARREKRVVVTHDLDFANLLAASAAELPSVIFLCRQNMRPEKVIPRLCSLPTDHFRDLEKGAILSVYELRIRLRTLPLDASGSVEA